MYGYIRPDRGALTVLEFKRFQAAYCGLCEALKDRCGELARFVVSYDLTFLAMLLSHGGQTQWRRCPVHPVQKRPIVCSCETFDMAADESVVLAWWKLQDGVADKSLIFGLPERSAMKLLEGAYQKASERCPAFDETVRSSLRELSELEGERCPSLDRTADCFARILASAAAGAEAEKRIQREVLYHVGRSIYILDAIDDYEKDRRDGSYNPLICRQDKPTDRLSEEEKASLLGTLTLSQRCAAKALELRQEDVWQPILRNILCRGLPATTRAVLAGNWKKSNQRYPDILEQGEEMK